MVLITVSEDPLDLLLLLLFKSLFIVTLNNYKQQTITNIESTKKNGN